MTLSPISARQTYGLRQSVLRPHQAIEEVRYPGDEDPLTLHGGVWVDAELVGVISICKDTPPGESLPNAWRIRGMAVSPAMQGRGYGRRLVGFACQHASEQNGDLIWCNARVAASEFYVRLGFATVGEAFDIAGIGPHFVMYYRP